MDHRSSDEMRRLLAVVIIVLVSAIAIVSIVEPSARATLVALLPLLGWVLRYYFRQPKRK